MKSTEQIMSKNARIRLDQRIAERAAAAANISFLVISGSKMDKATKRYLQVMQMSCW
jgi:hypothetical protein